MREFLVDPVAEAEVLATGLTAEHFASAATLEAALRARGIGHPAKVGDRDLQSKDLPGCCIVRSDYSEIAQVRSDRSYVWLHEAGESAYARVDDLTTSRWEVLALHVPDDATPEQARALVGLSGEPPQSTTPPPPAVAVGDKGVPSERVPEGAVVRHPSGDVYHVRAGGAIWHIGDGTGPQDRASIDRTLERRAFPSAGWEVLALGVPATATAREARIAAGLEPSPSPAPATRPAAVADGVYVTTRGAVYVSEGGSRTWLADHDGHPAERPDLYEAGEPCPRGHLDSGPRLVSGKPADDRLLLELRSRAEVDAALLAWPTTADAVARFGEALGWQRCFYNDTNAPNNPYSVMGLADGRAVRVFGDRSGHDERNEYTDHARRGLWLSAAPDARTDFYLLRAVPEGDRARTLVRAARKVNLTGRAADAADVFRAAAAGAQGAQAPSWARDYRGALVAFPDGRTLLWWHVTPDGKRYAWIDSSSAEALRPTYTAQDLPRDAAQAEVLLDEMDEGEVAQAALLRPHTVSAARSVAAMLRSLRSTGAHSERGWAILRSHRGLAGVAHGRAFRWVCTRGALSDLTLYKENTWVAEQRWRSVLADDLTEAQARTFAERVADLPDDAARQRYAVEAARHWHALGPERMTASPPAGHEWARAGLGAVEVGAAAMPDLGEVFAFGSAAGPPSGTLVRFAGGPDSQVWLRTCAGWAYLTAPRYDDAWRGPNGWPGDIELRDLGSRGTSAVRVMARDLAPEEQALLCLAAHRARSAGAPFFAEHAAKAVAEVRASWSASDQEARDKWRGGILGALSAEPWRAGWADRTPSGTEAAAGALRLGDGPLTEAGLTYRYVRNALSASAFLRFADWRGFVLGAPHGDVDPETVKAQLLEGAVRAALAVPALTPRGRDACDLRYFERPPPAYAGWPGAGRLRARLPGADEMLPVVPFQVWEALSRDIVRAGLAPQGAGVVAYVLEPSPPGRATCLPLGGRLCAEGRTLLAVVGAATEPDLARACQAVLPRLVRTARERKRQPALVALGPETRARLL